MQAAWGFLSALFWGVLLLSVLVFVHEGGHYLAARAFGVRVTEFFLGLPCRARFSVKSKKVGTESGVTPLASPARDARSRAQRQQSPS